MKKLIIILAVILGTGAIAYTLYANKEDMKEKAKLAEVSSGAIPVEVVKPELSVISDNRALEGVLKARTDLLILSETQGKVVKQYKEKGDRVGKGELLAQIENDLIQAEVDAAEANLEKLQLDVERFERLSETNAVTQRQLEDVKIGLKNAEAQFKGAKKRLENTYIRATAAGMINDDFIQEGEFINPGAKLFEIVNVKDLILDVKLTADEVLKVHEGDEIEISISNFNEEKFKGSVTAVAFKADAALKYNVQLELENNKEDDVKPGMYATAKFNFKSESEKLLINRNAIIGSVQDAEVFIVKDSTAELRPIQIGAIKNDMVEVISGIDQNDVVVLNGHINLNNGTKVNIVK